MTVSSMPEQCRSSTPELKRRRKSVDVTDTEVWKTSPAAYVSDGAVDQSTVQFPSPSWTSATGQLHILSAHGIASAAESSHVAEHDDMHVSESSQCPDTSKIPATGTETVHSGRKKKKRRSPVFSDDSKDVGHTAVKEDRKHKHKHKDRLSGTGEKDEKHKSGNVASKTHNKDSAADTLHSDHEAKQKKSADGAKHKRIVDDVVYSESVNDKTNKRTKSDEKSAFKSSDDDRTKISESVAKIVRQYRHQDGIHERTCNKASSSSNSSHKKREKTVTSVSVLNQFCCLLITLNLSICKMKLPVEFSLFSLLLRKHSRCSVE